MKKQNNFQNIIYNANDFAIGNILVNGIKRFFIEHIIHSTNNKFFILLKVKFKGGSTKTFHQGVIINKISLNNYLKYLEFKLEFKADEYKDDSEYDSIIISYFYIPTNREHQFNETKWEDLTKNKEIIKLNETNFYKYKLPVNTDYETWGDYKLGTPKLRVIIGNNYNYIVEKENNITNVNVMKDNKIIVSFTDEKALSPYGNEGYFIRKIDNYTFYCKAAFAEHNEILLFTNKLNTKFLEPLKVKPLTKTKIITIDIETLVKKGIHKPYLFSMFDGTNNYSWFDDNASELLNKLLTRKYKGYDVYAHNLSKFDLIFLHKDIAKLNSDFNIKFLKRDDKYISINISNPTRNISITIKDSLNLLPESLHKLSKQFNVETPKGIEPVYRNKGDSLSYYYLEDISHYNKEVEIVNDLNEWKSKVQNYCENDCVALYQVLIKFRTLIYDKFEINIDIYPTIPSVAFAIFKTHYMEANTIPIIKGRIYDFIHESFTGGSTEVYKPEGTNIYCYDVNSLYPSSMKYNKFPVGNIVQFQGNIDWLYKLDPAYNKENSYWIGDAEVSTIKDLHKPYLQINHLTKDNGLVGRRTISPNGTFNMKINSPEYYNAVEINKDYNIKINSGFLFEAKDIFSQYVDEVYQIKKDNSKSSPMYLISKLLMNSLYGRFAMKPINHISKYIDRDEDIFNFIENNIILDYQDIDKETIFISYQPKNKDNIEGTEGGGDDFKNSIAIASAVTSYSRVFMSQFKNESLYYTDTDSIFIDKELDSKLINTKLGAFKLEYTFKEIVFLGPKIYAGITTDGKYIAKIKGFKKPSSVPFDVMKSLLVKDSNVKLNHKKWFRNISESEILMKDQLYELSKTYSKRTFIYKDNIAIDTEALKLVNNFNIINN
jgi:hypothetical protein